MRRLTNEEFILKSIEKHGQRYDYSKVEYSNAHKNVIIVCNTHGEFSQLPDKHVAGQGCRKCGYEKNVITKSGTYQILVDLATKNQGKCLSIDYVKSITKYDWQCKEGHVFSASASDLLNKDRWCPTCAHKSMGVRYRSDISMYQKLAEERGGRLITQKYEHAHVAMEWECSKGHRWQATGSNVKKSTWCPVCRDSGGERRIHQYLINKLKLVYNVDFFSEYTFDDCKDIRKLRFDFYIPFINTIVEYDGEHHFFDSFGNPEKHEMIKRHDVIKNNYCLEKGIKMIRIPYTDLKKLEQVLELNLQLV